MEDVTFPYSSRKEPDQGELAGDRLEDSVVVSVMHRQEGDRRRATVLQNTSEAECLVEALIAAGCDRSDIGVFLTREVAVQVTYHAVVHLGWDASRGAQEAAPSVGAPIASVEQPNVDAPVAEAPAVAVPAAPRGWGIHIRADRFVWICLWAVSIAVLGASLVTSLSRPAPREFVPGVPTSDLRSLAPEAAVLDSASGPSVVQDSAVPDCAQAGIDNCQCSDFATQADAQAFYERFPAADGHVVDTDGDGAFCDWLPAATPRP